MKNIILGNRIFLNCVPEDLKKEYPGVDFFEAEDMSADGFRSFMDRCRFIASPTTAVVLDASRMSDRQFSACLKLLEEVDFVGGLRFYGAALSRYPITIRSRCAVVAKEVKSGTKTIPLAKPVFMDFMHTLDMMKPAMFNTIVAFFDRVPGEEFADLFFKWLDEDKSSFTARELDICKFLRSNHFLQMWQHNSQMEEHLMLFLVCYKVMFAS